MEKRQLNLYVDPSIDAEFREEAMKAGFGRKGASLLEVLLAVYRPNLPRLYNRMRQALAGRTEFSREERFYAGQLRDLFATIAQPPAPSDE